MKNKLVGSQQSTVESARFGNNGIPPFAVCDPVSTIKKSFYILHFTFYIKISLLFAAFLLSCANPQPPSGGPPDKSPPVISRYAPAQGTLNYDAENITIEFNKYMNKNTVLENIFISPSVKMKFGWSGKELEINFEEDLKDSTTYVFSLGTEYSDLKGNKPSESFSLIFSTGNYLDSGAISGNLIDANPAGTNIYAYKIDNINPDTLNPAHTKPNYRTQAGQNGNFNLVALKEGNYRIIAIRDKFKDEVYDEGLDDFGAAPFDVDVSGDSTPVVNLKIGPAKDKAGPQLFSTESLNSNLVELLFSENLDTNFINAHAFRIRDSLNKSEAEISGAMLSPKSANKVWIFTQDILDTGKLWKIIAISSQNSCIRDTSGNSINDTSNIVYFYSVIEKNTTQPEIIKLPFSDSSLYVSSTPDLNFIFNLPVEKTQFAQSGKATSNSPISFTDADSLKIIFDIIWISDNILKIIPNNKLEPLKWYFINVRMNQLTAVNGLSGKDTTARLKFRIQDTRNFGGINGKIKNLNQPDSTLRIIVFNNKDKYVTCPVDSGKWHIPSLQEGKYQFELFFDTDRNGKYSYGEAYPFKHSEPFILIKEEKEVPARWTVEIELPSPAKNMK